MKKTEIEILLSTFSSSLQRLIVYVGEKNIKKNQEYIRTKRLLESLKKKDS